MVTSKIHEDETTEGGWTRERDDDGFYYGIINGTSTTSVWIQPDHMGIVIRRPDINNNGWATANFVLDDDGNYSRLTSEELNAGMRDASTNPGTKSGVVYTVPGTGILDEADLYFPECISQETIDKFHEAIADGAGEEAIIYLLALEDTEI